MLIAHAELKKQVHLLMDMLKEEAVVSSNKEALDRIAAFLGTEGTKELLLGYIRTHPLEEKEEKELSEELL